jgi:hypothetical protein
MANKGHRVECVDQTARVNKWVSLQMGNKSTAMYLIIITDAKVDFENMALEKHHQSAHERASQKMKNASATQPVSVTIDGHSSLQDEITGTKNGISRVFLHATCGRRQSFSTNPRVNTQIAVPKQNQQLRAHSPRVSGVSGNVIIGSGRAPDLIHVPAPSHVWLRSASIVFHSSAVS